MNRFQEMHTFAAVADAGSFVGAADALAMSKAAVSRQVRELEARLGVRLMNRTTRRLSLTPEGEVFLARCRELLADLDEAEAEITTRSGRVRGLLRVNVPVDFGIRRLAPLWGPFQARYPEVAVEVTLADRRVDLVEEGYDLAVRIGRLASDSLVARPLTTTRLIVCASPDYLAARGTPAHPRELADHAVIGYSYWSTGDDWSLRGPDGVVSVRTRPRLRSNNGETCRASALAGQGVVLQPAFLVGDDVDAGRLVALFPDYAAGDLGVHAVYPSRRHVAPKVQALVTWLRDHLGGAAIRTGQGHGGKPEEPGR